MNEALPGPVELWTRVHHQANRAWTRLYCFLLLSLRGALDGCATSSWQEGRFFNVWCSSRQMTCGHAILSSYSSSSWIPTSSNAKRSERDTFAHRQAPVRCSSNPLNFLLFCFFFGWKRDLPYAF